MPTAEEANRDYFRNAYRTRKHAWEIEEPSPLDAAFLQRTRMLAPGGRLLDIGCGEGRHSILAARLGFQVTAVDYERLALRRARGFARRSRVTGIQFREANIFALPFPVSSFDVVLDCGCLHHQKKSRWKEYGACLLRVLKPHGFYILSVFSPRFRLFQRGGQSWHIAYGAYRRCFTKSEILGLFGRDFDIIEMVEERGRGFWHALMQRRSDSQRKETRPCT